jgi:hypothetical protein
MKTAPHLFWLTTEAYPLGHAGVAFGDILPRCFPDGTAQVTPSSSEAPSSLCRIGGGGFNQLLWLEAKPLPGLTAPVLHQSWYGASFHSSSFPSIGGASSTASARFRPGEVRPTDGPAVRSPGMGGALDGFWPMPYARSQKGMSPCREVSHAAPPLQDPCPCQGLIQKPSPDRTRHPPGSCGSWPVPACEPPP